MRGSMRGREWAEIKSQEKLCKPKGPSNEVMTSEMDKAFDSFHKACVNLGRAIKGLRNGKT